MKLARIWCIWR